MGDKARFRVVGKEYENDPGLANVVWALNPERKHIRLSVDVETIRRLRDSRLFAPIGEYCGLIHGAVPNGTPGLIAAHALFQGLQRPRTTIGRDDEIYVYVLNPEHSYFYGPGEVHRATGPRQYPKRDCYRRTDSFLGMGLGGD